MSHKAKLQSCATVVRLPKIRFPSQGQQSVLLVRAGRNWIHPFPGPAESLLHRGTTIRHVANLIQGKKKTILHGKAFPWLFLELHLSYKAAEFLHGMVSRVILELYLRNIHMKSHHFFPINPPSVTNTAETKQETVKATVSYTLITFPSRPPQRWKFSLLLNTHVPNNR